MPILVRHLEHVATRWADSFELPADQRVLHPELLLDLLEVDRELSFWRLDNEAELLRLLAAFGCLQKKIENQTVVLIDEQGVRDLGIELRDELGKTPDGEMNARHTNIKIPTVELVHNLAKYILEHARFKTHPAQEIEQEIKRQLDAGIIKVLDGTFKITDSGILRRFIGKYCDDARRP